MFTGIISKTAKVVSATSNKNGVLLEIENKIKKVKAGLPVQAGESISINGVCSTVKKADKTLTFDYMPETLKLTNLAGLKKGDIVNLEQSLRFGDTLSGHIVLGHIDGKGTIVSIKKEGNSKVFEIKFPSKAFKKFLIYKGSVAVEGISLTIAKVLKDSFIVKIIPHTLANTNLKLKKKGNLLNIEFDILAKYANQK